VKSPFVNLVTSTNGWKDTNACQLGVTCELSDTAGLRFGCSFDETSEGDDHFSDPNGSFLYDGKYAADVHLLGLGISRCF
jgi:long-subunit fatty acid transport protein